MIRQAALIFTFVAFSSTLHARVPPELATTDFFSFAVPRIVKMVKTGEVRLVALAARAACYVHWKGACGWLAARLKPSEREGLAAALPSHRPGTAVPESVAPDYVELRRKAERACTGKNGAGCREWGELESRMGRRETARRLFTLACAYGDTAACGRIRPRDAREISIVRAAAGRPLSVR